MIDEIDCGIINPLRQVRIALCQIAIEPDQFAGPGRTLDTKAFSVLEARVIRTLSEIRDFRPQIVQFPECSIPSEMLHHLRKWSRDNDAIIIAGTHYEPDGDNFISKCPIIFPNGNEFACEKITISPLEKRPVPGQKVIPGSVRYMFRNSTIGNFMVLICSDLLDPDTAGSIEDLNPDIVFVCSFQSDSKRYHSVLSNLCINSKDGVYYSYSNCYSPTGGADGKSGLFAVTDRKYLPTFKEAGMTNLIPEQKLWEAQQENDFVICDFDIETKKASLPKSAMSDPNVHIVNTRTSVLSTRSKSTLSRKFRLIAFDMDGTLLRGIDFSWSKLWEMCGDDGRQWRGYLSQYRKDMLSYEDWCNIAVKYFRNSRLSKDLIFEVARDCARITHNFDAGMKEIRKGDFKTALISGGVDIFLRAIIPNYKDYFDYVFINSLLFDADDIVSGVDITPYDYQGKAKALKLVCDAHGFDLKESIFVGDTFNDEYAIKSAGHSILYSSSRDGVRHMVDHEIVADDFNILAQYVLDISK